mgnify:CR=1 FL=1
MRLTACVAVALLWPGAALAESASPAPKSADELLACMRANIPPTVRIQEVELVTVDRGGGERTMRGRLYGAREDGLVRVMLRIDAPADLAGAAYLIREEAKSDQMYLYLPAINRVRRITGGSGDNQLFGTDLSYNDIKQVQNAFSAVQVKDEGNEQLAGATVRVISFAPAPESESRYDRIVASVDPQRCMALRVAFYEGGKLRKQLDVESKDLKQSGSYWYAERSVMRDLVDQTQTRLRVDGVRSGDDVSGRYFNPRSFYLGG